jgi:hypothetical protein
MEKEKKTKTEKWKLFFETIQALLTCGAIITAACWFFLQAEGESKAKCSHKLSMVKVDIGGSNFWWGCLEVKIENVGQIPFNPTQGILKVSQIKPLPADLNVNIDKNGRFRWPQLLSYTNVMTNPIRPGEVDYRNFEFAIPTNVETFRVYSYLNLGKDRPLGWSKASIYTIKDDKIVQIETPED